MLAYVSMIRGVRVWLPPAAKTNLRSRPASLFLHVLINEGSSNIGEVGLCWGRNHLFGRRRGGTLLPDAVSGIGLYPHS